MHFEFAELLLELQILLSRRDNCKIKVSRAFGGLKLPATFYIQSYKDLYEKAGPSFIWEHASLRFMPQIKRLILYWMSYRYETCTITPDKANSLVAFSRI